jgi:hypothetical protein
VVFNTQSNVKHDVISFFAEKNQDQSICIQDPDGKILTYQVFLLLVMIDGFNGWHSLAIILSSHTVYEFFETVKR